MKLENWQPVIPSSLCATSSWCCCCTKLLRHFHCFRDLKDKGYEHMTNSSLLYIWPTCIYIWLNAYACAPFLWKPCGITPLQKPRWQLLLFFSFSNWRVTPKSKLPCVNCWKDLVVLHSNTSGFVFVSPSYSLEFCDVPGPGHVQCGDPGIFSCLLQQESMETNGPSSLGCTCDSGRCFPHHWRVMPAWISWPALIPLQL